MKPVPLSPEQRRYIAERYGLDGHELDLLLGDLWSFTGENPEAYVSRRHRELQRELWPNEAIFKRLAEELSTGRFASSPRTIRQIRRMIYG
ncbi:MAG: hypothetical protein ACLQMF_05510 [Rectinemataceae bacterium]